MLSDRSVTLRGVITGLAVLVASLVVAFAAVEFSWNSLRYGVALLFDIGGTVLAGYVVRMIARERARRTLIAYSMTVWALLLVSATLYFGLPEMDPYELLKSSGWVAVWSAVLAALGHGLAWIGARQVSMGGKRGIRAVVLVLVLASGLTLGVEPAVRSRIIAEEVGSVQKVARSAGVRIPSSIRWHVFRYDSFFSARYRIEGKSSGVKISALSSGNLLHSAVFEIAADVKDVSNETEALKAVRSCEFLKGLKIARGTPRLRWKGGHWEMRSAIEDGILSPDMGGCGCCPDPTWKNEAVLSVSQDGSIKVSMGGAVTVPFSSGNSSL